MSSTILYKIMLHTHKLVVILFLLHYFIKTLLLLMNKKELLEKYSKPTKVPEMIISTLFLLTGIVMIAKGAVMNTYMYIKIAAVLVSIPLAVVGFKKQNKGLAGLAFLLIVTAYGLAEMSKISKSEVKIDTTTLSGDPVTVGKVIYANNCIACHGPGGDLMAAGAKNLRNSGLDDAAIKAIIRNGKNSMPAYKTLTEEQLDGLLAYVRTLRD